MRWTNSEWTNSEWTRIHTAVLYQARNSTTPAKILNNKNEAVSSSDANAF